PVLKKEIEEKRQKEKLENESFKNPASLQINN
ncbi:MAG: hypothetical protein QG610_486, partial [Euryarchaeota archaeon]|nr:hypothetical protein [Euryarchaeota archaeon]